MENAIRMVQGIPQIPQVAAEHCATDKRIRKVVLAPGKDRNEIVSRLKTPCNLVWTRNDQTEEMEFAGSEKHRLRARPLKNTCIAYSDDNGRIGTAITGWELTITRDDLEIFSQYCVPKGIPAKGRIKYLDSARRAEPEAPPLLFPTPSITRPPDQRRKRELWGRQDGRCAGCCRGMPVTDMAIDHIIPTRAFKEHGISLEFLNIDHNLQLLCARCNSQKGGNTEAEFMSQAYLRIASHTPSDS